MADLEGKEEAKNFYPEVEARQEAFFLKGSGALDWGMQNRLGRIFNPFGAHGNVGDRPRIFPGADDGAGTRGPEHLFRCCPTRTL